MVNLQAVRAIPLRQALKEALPVAAGATAVAVAGKLAAERAKLGNTMFDGPNGRFQAYLQGMTAALSFASNLVVEALVGKSAGFQRLAAASPMKAIMARFAMAIPFVGMATFIAEKFSKERVTPGERLAGDESIFEAAVHRHMPTGRGATPQNAKSEIHTIDAHSVDSHAERDARRARRSGTRHPKVTKTPVPTNDLRFAFQPVAAARSQALFNGNATTVASLPQFGQEGQNPAVSMVGTRSVFNPFMTAERNR